MEKLPDWKDKTLFTPGPLTTSRTVKQAMLRDLGSRDTVFVDIVRDIRRRLVALSGADPAQYVAVLMQGSGTFGVEAVLSSVVPPKDKLLVLVNGAYGERVFKMAVVHRIPVQVLRSEEDTYPSSEHLERALAADPTITHIAAVHCETTTGIINPVQAYGAIARQHGAVYIVDAMSSYGAYPLNPAELGIHYLVSSANKCIEGVPGFSFALAHRESLLATRGTARTLSLDLLAQYEGLEGDGQFRFTPPTHALLAFHQALLELEAEGGVAARAARYRRNHQVCVAGMEELGFRTYLRPEEQGYTITSFRYPEHREFSFRRFYESLAAQGHVIYPGKLSHADCFRIGHVGRIDEHDVRALLSAVRQTLVDMDLDLGGQDGIRLSA
jgi:2-aminoethylphosphonate-pyruvate transaminase